MIDLLLGVRAVHIAATVIGTGTVFFRFFIANPTLRVGMAGGSTFQRQLTSIVGYNLAIAFASGSVWLLLLAANIGREPIADAFADGTVARLLTETLFGQVLVIRFSLGVVLALTLYQSATDGWRGAWLPVFLAAGFLSAMAWCGHSGATPGWSGTIYLGADVVHLLAAGAWLGGLLPFALLLNLVRGSLDPNWSEVALCAVRRFSILGILSVGALLATGLVATWNLVGSVQNLIGSNYGWLLLVKIVLFAVMVLIAAINRLRLTPHLPSFDALRNLRRNSLIEIGLGLCIVVIVGTLGTMPPASHSHRHVSIPTAIIPPDAAFTHIHGEKAMAEITISPGRVGPVSIRIFLMDDDFSPLAAKNVELSLTGPNNNTINAQAIEGGDGNWIVNDLTIPQPGIWNVQVGIRTSDDLSVVLDDRVSIER